MQAALKASVEDTCLGSVLPWLFPPCSARQSFTSALRAETFLCFTSLQSGSEAAAMLDLQQREQGPAPGLALACVG